MYHGVVPSPDFSLSVNHLSVKDFKRHIEYLNENFKIRKLTDLFEDYRNGVVASELEIAITFDDGYLNNYKYAFPILKETKTPATIFVVTQALTDPENILWYDFIDGVKFRIDYKKFSVFDFGFASEKVRIQKNVSDADSLKSFMKRISADEKYRIIQWIKNQGIEPDIESKKDFFKLLAPVHIKEMIHSGLVEFGSHTHNHPNLSEISMAEAEQEVIKSKKLLEDSTGIEIKSIAFPDGSYNEAVKNICIKIGYKNLLAVDYKLGSDRNDKSILPRFCISNTTTSESNFFNLNNNFRKKGF